MTTSLSSLVAPSLGTVSYYKQNSVIAVYNSSVGNGLNGGQCCLWTAPGPGWVIFEMWGAGGDGAGASCCAGPGCGMGAGNYSRKYLTVSAGLQFTVCAASSGCCWCCNCGSGGAQQCAAFNYPSYVLCANSTLVACAAGGNPGTIICGKGNQQCTGVCAPGGMYGTTCCATGDYTAGSFNSSFKDSNYCNQYMFTWTTMPLKGTGTSLYGFDYCSPGIQHCGQSSFPNQNITAWPGGAGAMGNACAGSTQFYGQNGAGGLVLITYGT